MSFEQGVLVRDGKVVGGISPDVLPLIGNVETVGTASKNDYSANTGLFINSLDLQIYRVISDIDTGDILSPYPSGGENSNCALLNGYNVLNLMDELYSFMDANSTFAGVGHCTTDGATAIKTVNVTGLVNINTVIGVIFTNTNTATESEVKIKIYSGSGIQTYDIQAKEPDSRAYGVANYMSLYTVVTVTPSEGDPYEALEFIGSFAPGESSSGNLVELEYGVSTYAEFLEAYQKHKIVYCKASSSGTNPAYGSKVRKAFMAYVNNDTTPTEVEFQYYRSLTTYSEANQHDEVHVYKLSSSTGWSYTKRVAGQNIEVSNGLSATFSSNKVTLSVDQTMLDGLNAELSDKAKKDLSNVTGTLAVANGGTGANSAANARTNLGLGGAATQAVANNLTTTAAGSVLDARQGKALSDKIGSETLDTTATNCIGAINELLASFSNALTNLKATAIAQAVGATAADTFTSLITKLATISTGDTSTKVVGTKYKTVNSTNRIDSITIPAGYYPSNFVVKSTPTMANHNFVSFLRRGNTPLFEVASNIHDWGTGPTLFGRSISSSLTMSSAGTYEIRFRGHETQNTNKYISFKFDYETTYNSASNFKIVNSSGYAIRARVIGYGRVVNAASDTSYYIESSPISCYADIANGGTLSISKSMYHKYIRMNATWTHYVTMVLSFEDAASE